MSINALGGVLRSFLWPSFLLILDRVWDEPKQMTSHIFKPCPVSHRTPCRVEGASRSQTHSQPHYRLHAVGTAWMCSWGRTGQAEKEPRKVEVAGGGVPDSVSQSALWIWNVQLDLPKTKVENLPTNSRGLKPYKISVLGQWEQQSCLSLKMTFRDSFPLGTWRGEQEGDGKRRCRGQNTEHGWALRSERPDSNPVPSPTGEWPQHRLSVHWP